jgi:hypothetical protein
VTRAPRSRRSHWRKLYDALATLARACGGTFAFVLDEGDGLWCVGLADSAATTATSDENRATDRFYRDVMVPRLADERPAHVVRREGRDLGAAPV